MTTGTRCRSISTSHAIAVAADEFPPRDRTFFLSILAALIASTLVSGSAAIVLATAMPSDPQAEIALFTTAGVHPR